MTARLAACLLLTAACVASAAGPSTRPGEGPLTYKLKTVEQWMPSARDLDPKTRLEGIDAIIAFVGRRPELAPFLVDTLEGESSPDVFRSLTSSLRVIARVNPAAISDRLDGLMKLLRPPGDVYSQGDIIRALTSLAEGVDLQADLREKIINGFAEVVQEEKPSDSLSWRGQSAVEALVALAPKHPKARSALRRCLNAPSPHARLATVAALVKVDPEFSSTDAAARIAAVIDEVDVSTGQTAGYSIGGWLNHRLGPDEVVGQMKPPDQQVVARAIARLVRRAPNDNAGPIYFYNVLVSFGPAAGPAALAVRDYNKRTSFSRTSEQLAELDLIAAATVGYDPKVPVDGAATRPATAPSTGPSGRR